MTALGTFGAFAAARVRGSITPDVQELIKLHTLDTVAAWVAGTRTPEGKRLLAYRARLDPGVHADISVNCALARLTEIDDIHLPSMTTPGAFIVPAALSIAASLPQSDAHALCEAILAGYEAMTRLGAALDGPSVLYRGIWPSYACAGFGVAAAAARLMDLTPDEAAHALALALNLSGAGVGQHGAATTARWLAAGSAARNGLAAAQAAQAGFTADLSLLDGRFFPGVYDITPDLAALTGDLGERTTLTEVAFKPWCAARQTMAATQAFKEIIAREIDVDGITAVEAAVPPLFLRMIDHGVAEHDRLSRLTSLPYQIAAAVVAPELAFDVAQADEVSPALRAFMAKVKVLADETLMEGFPAQWRARVRVEAGGTWHEHLIAQIPGDPGRPFAEADVTEKFHRLADEIVGAERVDELCTAVAAVLEGHAAPMQLFGALSRAVG